jgi:hypothetical protein
MQTSSIRATGAVVLFKATDDMDLIGVDTAFASIGRGDLSPNPRTRLATIKAALTALAGIRKNQRIVRLEDAEGYAVVNATASLKGGASAEQGLSAHVRDTEKGPVVTISDPAQRDRFALCLKAAKGQVDGDAVSTCVTQAIKALGGVALREGGGVYWLPDDAVEAWKTLGAGLEEACIRRAARAYTITTQGDPDSVRAFVDAFLREADALVSEVEDDLVHGSKGARAATNRAQSMSDLSDLAGRYEKTLGVGLTEIRTRIDKVQGQAAHTALLALDL